VKKTGTLGNEKIPMVRDVATWIYLENPNMPGWSEQPITCILADLPWLEEGTEVELCDLRPEYSHMGTVKLYRVLVSKAVVQLHSGKYGQAHRRVLLEEIPDGELSGFLEDDAFPPETEQHP
jgi:hypothetical protein